MAAADNTGASVKYVINATWDDEAGVWVAESDEIPGLITEAPTFETLQEKLCVLVPELLELNNCMPKARTVLIDVFLHGEIKKQINLSSAA